MFIFIISGSERDFFDRLYDDYRKPMWFYALSIVRDGNYANDAVQSAFMHLIDKHKTLSALDSRRLKAYIAITVRNAAIDILRQDKANLIIPVEDIAAITDTAGFQDRTADFVIRLENSQQIQDALSRLSSRHKDAITLRYLYGYSHADISDVLGTTPGNVKVMIHRALQSLKKQIQGDKL